MTLRNDLDDEPRRPARERKGGMPRWVPFAVVGIAAIGFGGLVGYGYWAFSDGQGRIAVPLVTAGQPYLEKPANPGGMEVAHGDLRIWNVGKNGASPAPKPESFVPPPETPLPRPAPAAPPPAPAPAAAQPGAAAGAAPAPAQAAPAEQPLQVDTRPPPGPIPKPPPPAPPVRAVAVVPGAAAALPPPARAGSPAGARIQLGSVRSEADARKLWDSVRRKHPAEVGTLTAHISRVDFPDRGTFYRVNAGTLPDRDAARDMCAKLRKAGTECIVAAPN